MSRSPSPSTPTRCRAGGSSAGCSRRWASPTRRILGYGTTMKAPDYLAINPMGKVPAIKHGDTVVTEAAAICAYLADAFPDAGPRAAAGQPPARPLLSLDVLRRRSGRGGDYRQGARPRSRRRQGAHGRLRHDSRTTIDALEQAVARRAPLSCAASNSRAADVYVGASIGWGMEFGIIEKRPPSPTMSAASRTAPPTSARSRSTTRSSPSSRPSSRRHEAADRRIITGNSVRAELVEALPSLLQRREGRASTGSARTVLGSSRSS